MLPSFSEGLPMAVLEALSWGKPCLITKECNLDISFKNGGAFEIKRDINLLKNSLAKWAQYALHESKFLEDFGMQGRELIKHNFSWNIIGEKFIEMYDSLNLKKL